MTKFDEYVANAEECRLMAQRAWRERDKSRWLDIAESWLGLIRKPKGSGFDAFGRPGSGQGRASSSA